jgi:hypothetical protein
VLGATFPVATNQELRAYTVFGTGVMTINSAARSQRGPSSFDSLKERDIARYCLRSRNAVLLCQIDSRRAPTIPQRLRSEHLPVQSCSTVLRRSEAT